MSMKYIIAILLALIGISCAVLLVIFLVSAALYGSLILTGLCLMAFLLYFVGTSKLNRNNES